MSEVVFKFDIDEIVYVPKKLKEECSMDYFEEAVVTAIKRSYGKNYYLIIDAWIEESFLLSYEDYVIRYNQEIAESTDCINKKIEHLENL